MPNRRRAAVAGIVAIMSLTVASCDDPGGFDVGGAAAFQASCLARSAEVVDRMNAVPAAALRVDVPIVASLIASYAVPPVPVELSRGFDPKVIVPVAGFDRTGEADPAKSCAVAARNYRRYADVSPVEALRLGMSNVFSAVSSEITAVRGVRREILDRQSSIKAEAVRLRQAMDKYAPKGVTFRLAVEDGRYVPSIVLDAANVVDRPITAFILTIRLVGADGVPIGAGRVRFVPPVPLGAGVESSYVLDLAGVRGIDTKSVTSYSGAVRIFVVLDDLFIEGKPVLGDLVVSPLDKARVDSLDVLMNTMLRYRDTIRAVRERQIVAFG